MNFRFCFQAERKKLFQLWPSKYLVHPSTRNRNKQQTQAKAEQADKHINARSTLAV